MAKEYWVVRVERDESVAFGIFILLLVFWGGSWLKDRFSSIDFNGLSWRMFVPDGIIHFFNLPFHYWFLVAITVWFCIFVPLLLIIKVGEKESALASPIIFLIPVLLLWLIVGIMYGFKHYFSTYGFFSSILIGLKTMWYSSIGFFSAASTGISWINLTIGFIVLLLLMAIAMILSCQLLFYIFEAIGFINLLQNIGMNDIVESSTFILVFILIAWVVFSLGGILWLLLT